MQQEENEQEQPQVDLDERIEMLYGRRILKYLGIETNLEETFKTEVKKDNDMYIFKLPPKIQKRKYVKKPKEPVVEDYINI